jgi:uncharacterized membrane protein
MKHDPQLIIVAAYGNLDDAHTDFNDLERGLKHGMETRSAALVTKGADGQAEVSEAANRHGRTGTLMGAGVGLMFGLVFEPLLLGVLVGGAGGALVTALAEHELRSGLKTEVGDALENGTAVVLALSYSGGQARVENTLIRAHSIRSLQMDRASIKSIDDAVAQEIAKLHTDAGPDASSGTTDTSS